MFWRYVSLVRLRYRLVAQYERACPAQRESRACHLRKYDCMCLPTYHEADG